MRLLRQYDGVQPVNAAEMWKMRKTTGVTMSPLDGVHVRLHKA